MKRRNFLSGLFAAPLALKARFAQFFVRKPVESCGIAIFSGLGPKVPGYYQPFPNLQLLAQGKSLKEASGPPIKIPPPRARQLLERRMGTVYPTARCSLPRGHNGPHGLLNPR
jgi:hypothetical protein